jgi:hypothetical protein
MQQKNCHLIISTKLPSIKLATDHWQKLSATAHRAQFFLGSVRVDLFHVLFAAGTLLGRDRANDKFSRAARG